MTAEQTIEAVRDMGRALGCAKLEEAVNLATVKAVNGPDGIATSATVKVTLTREGGKYRVKVKSSVKQAETENLDDAEDAVDPAQMIMKGVR